MKPEDREPDLDRVLDDALARYSDVEPRVGLEQRILANLRSQPAARPWFAVWRVPAMALAAAVVLAVGFTLLRPAGKQAKNTAVQQATQPAQTAKSETAVPPTAGSAASTPAAERKAAKMSAPARAVQPHLLAEKSANRIKPQGMKMLGAARVPAVARVATGTGSEPRLETFPSPLPLSEQEGSLVLFVQKAPDKALAIAAEQEQYRKDIDARMRALGGGSR